MIEGYPWLAATILAGGLLAGGYVFRVINKALAVPAAPIEARRAVPRRMELAALALAVAAVLLGFVPLRPFGLLQIGRGDANLAWTP